MWRSSIDLCGFTPQVKKLVYPVIAAGTVGGRTCVVGTLKDSKVKSLVVVGVDARDQLEMEGLWKRLKLFGFALLATLCVGEEFRVDEGDPSASVSINYQDGRYEVRRENPENTM